jgi:flagellar hook-basal body complex protein FliE
MASPILNMAFPAATAALKPASASAAASGGIGATPAGGQSFSDLIKMLSKDGVQKGNETEMQGIKSLNKSTDVVDVVTAVTNAEVTLETAMAVRDRMIAAYQEIIRMPI